MKCVGCEENGKNFISKLIKNNALKGLISGYTENQIPLIELSIGNNPAKV